MVQVQGPEQVAAAGRIVGERAVVAGRIVEELAAVAGRIVGERAVPAGTMAEQGWALMVVVAESHESVT